RAAQALVQLRRDSEAEAVIRDVINRIERSQGAHSPRLIQPLITLSGALKQLQRLDGADAALERAIALARQFLGPRHYLLGSLLARQANLRLIQGRLQEALALFTEAEPMIGLEDLERGNLLTARGRTYISLKRYEEGASDL